VCCCVFGSVLEARLPKKCSGTKKYCHSEKIILQNFLRSSRFVIVKKGGFLTFSKMRRCLLVFQCFRFRLFKMICVVVRFVLFVVEFWVYLCNISKIQVKEIILKIYKQ